MEKYDIDLDEILKIKMRLADDDYDCGFDEGEGKTLSFKNILNEEKLNPILINEKEKYFALMLNHWEYYMAPCVQVILFVERKEIYDQNLMIK